MADNLRFLHIEDNPLDAEIIEGELRKEWPDCHYALISTEKELIGALAGEAFSVVLADYSLPGFDGMAALSIAFRSAPEIPFLFVTGSMGEEKAIETLKNGATDYILKTHLSKLIPSIYRALREVSANKERTEFLREMKRNLERLELMQEVNQYHAKSVQDLLDFALDKVISLTESSIGYIYHYHEEEHQFVLNTWSKDVMASCNVAESQTVYQLDKTGLWGEVVRQRCPILVNDYPESSELKKGYPHGHVHLSRFLSIPVFDDGKIVAVVGVANKMLPYDQTDELQLTMMMDGVWKIATRLKLEEQIMRAGHEWQSTFDSITDSLSLIDVDQRVIRCNQATCKILGREFVDILNHPCWQLFHGSDAPVPDCPMVRAKTSLHSETSIIQHNDRWLEVAVDPILSDQGVMTSAVHCVRDVTVQKNTQTEMEETRDYLEKLINYANAPIIVWDTDMTITRFNHSVERLSGYNQNEIVGRQLELLFPPDSRTCSVDLIAKTATGAMMENVEMPIQCKDGSIRYILWNSANIYAADAETLVSTIAQGLDITQRREMENVLQRQASVMNAVLESTDSLIFSVDSACCYTSFNSAHARNMKAHYNANIKIGEFLPGFMTHEDAVLAQACLDRAMGGESFVLETAYGDAQLERTIFEISHNPIRNDTGLIVGVAVLARDISERKKAEESYQEMQAQLMQNDKLATIGQLAAGVAHEINNPMGFVGSNMVTLGKYIEKYNRYIDLIEQQLSACSSGVLPEQIQELRKTLKLEYVMRDITVLVDECNEGIDRVKRIVQDLRTFSRTEADTTCLVDIQQCLESTINIINNVIRYAAELKREYGEIHKIRCNMQQISQVFMNLLINAVHAIQDKGGDVGKIIIRTWNDDDNVFVSVLDNGCGISQENRIKIFDAFYTTKDVGKGTGLGLSISSEIIRKHGGDIRVESEEGVGSTFTVRLPVNGPFQQTVPAD